MFPWGTKCFKRSWGSDSNYRGAEKKFVGEAFNVVGDVTGKIIRKHIMKIFCFL